MKNTPKIIFFIFIFSFVWTFPRCQDKSDNYFITVKPEANYRQQQIVSFSLPIEPEHENFFLQDSSGNRFPVQFDSKRTAWAIVDLPQDNNAIEFEILSGQNAEETNKIRAIDHGKSVSFSINDKPIFTYQKGSTLPSSSIDSAYLRGGYIHPVYTPSGSIITDDYPENHLHHHGIWGAWTKTEFEGRTPDFWNMGDKTGKVDFVSLDSLYDGPVMAGLSAKHEYVDLSGSAPKIALTESWDVNIFNLKDDSLPFYVFDIDISQECASSSSLILPTYRYGGMGFRGREEWNGEENTTFLTSEGKDRSNGHGTTARWCHVGGLVDGKPSGVTIMSHPDNFRAPQPMRIHPSEPFFNFAPSQAGDWAITPDKPYFAKYRFVVYNGEPNVDLLESLWQAYVNPLEVELKKK